MDLPNNVVITYELDGAGRRVGRRRVVNGGAATVRRYLLGEGNRVVAAYNENGTIVSQFVYATRSQVPDYMIQGSNIYRFVTDQLGSVRLVVNDNASSASASVVKQISYDAWGNITSETGTIDQPFGFAGGLQDRDTGLVHFGAREYDPFTGRWLQKDPIRFAGGDTNLYASGCSLRLAQRNRRLTGARPASETRERDVPPADWSPPLTRRTTHRRRPVG